jgi:ribonuclease R
MIRVGDIYRGKISLNMSGSAYFVCEDIAKDLYVQKENMNQSLHLDTVEILVIQAEDRPLEAKVLKVVKRFKDRFVGRIEISDSYAFFKPDNRKLSIDFYIPLNRLNGATDGQKVIAEMIEWRAQDKRPLGKIVEVLGDIGDNEVEINAIMEEYDLPRAFPQDVLDEAEDFTGEITDKEIKKRRDFRKVPTFTIDPADAKDFDDALSFRELEDNKYEIGIHIADVSYYVRPETSVDGEAFSRGTSIYLVDRVIPMIPEHLSNDICSLKPNEDRLCFSVVVTMNADGKILTSWIGRTVICSRYRFSYEEAQVCIDRGDSNRFMSDPASAFFGDYLVTLDKLAKKLRTKRLLKGAIEMKSPNFKFELDENKKPVNIIAKDATASNQLIEEFMLLANRKVAEYVRLNDLPLINRAHDLPDETKIEELKMFLEQFGFKVSTKTPAETKASLKKIIKEVEGKPLENMVNHLIVRTMSKAIYTTDKIGHYGLGFEDYCHFTSPIRRYPDIIVHRLLTRYLDGKYNINKSKLEGKCKHLSDRERKAQKAERESIKFKQAEYMSTKVGKIFMGVVTGVIDTGVFVELIDSKCEGFMRLGDISQLDDFKSDPKNHCVIGVKSGAKLRLGDELMVQIKKVVLERRVFEVSKFN